MCVHFVSDNPAEYESDGVVGFVAACAAALVCDTISLRVICSNNRD